MQLSYKHRVLINKLTRWILTLVCIYNFNIQSLWSQRPDLIVTTIGYSSPIVQRGDDFNVQFNVQNNSSFTAGQSFMFYYLSTSTTFTNDDILGYISVKQLMGQEITTVELNYPIPNNMPPGTYYVGCKLDVLAQINEVNENNTYRHPNPITITQGVKIRLRLPYPIIFIHGYTGSASTWDDIKSEFEIEQSLTFGGRMDFCLNMDNDHTKSNINTITNSDYKDFTNPNTLKLADFYTVNFAVDPNGLLYNNDTHPNQSNQAAVYKQGRAIKDAVKHVLHITGRDKVILAGHSMGGLAAREYLQNSGNYQSDGKHHVAKLLTIGTPHGGSNFSGFGLGIFTGHDEHSEAVRDLRNTYSTGKPGCYLFGGVESTNNIFGNLTPFKNIDVNCNGQIGNTIVGLNQKPIPEDISYSAVIGTGNSFGGGGDGIVPDPSANLQNYITPHVDTFHHFSTAMSHLTLHKDLLRVMKGLDEPNEPELAYNIELNKLYYGFSSAQPKWGYSVDFDMYKFYMPQPDQLSLSISNIPVSNLIATLYSNEGIILGSVTSNGKSNILIEKYLTQGTYYIEIESSWNSLSHVFPYIFMLTSTQTVSTIAQEYLTKKGKLFPNPAHDQATIELNHWQNESVDIIISNMEGKVLMKKTEKLVPGINSLPLEISGLPTGVYSYTIIGGSITTSDMFIKN